MATGQHYATLLNQFHNELKKQHHLAKKKILSHHDNSPIQMSTSHLPLLSMTSFSLQT